MSISRHSAYNIIGSILPLAVTLLTVPAYLSVVGIERYGILTICWVLLGYLGFLDLGLAPAVAQKIASMRNEEAGSAEAVFWTASWVSLAAGLISAAVFFGGAVIYFALGGPQSPFNSEIQDAVPLLGAILPVVMLSSVGAGALQGRQRFLALNMIQVTSSTLMSVLPLAVAHFWSPTLSGLIIGALAARFTGLLMQYWNCARAVPLSRIQMPRRALIGSLLRFGGWVTISTAVSPLLVTVDRLAIGAILGAAAVAAYSIPFSLITRMAIIPGAVSSALFPRFAAATQVDRKRLTTIAVAAIAVIMTPVSILTLAFVEPFFTLWLGRELAATSSPVAYFLIIGAWTNSIALVPLSMLQGSGRPDVVAKIHLLELLPYWLVLAGCLYIFGLAGAAIAWSIRTSADSLLMYWRSGMGFASLAPLLLPLLLLLVALWGVAADGPAKWFICLSSFCIACLWSSFHMPEAFREKLGVIGQLLPKRAL